jgi:hypothetical protein
MHLSYSSIIHFPLPGGNISGSLTETTRLLQKEKVGRWLTFCDYKTRENHDQIFFNIAYKQVHVRHEVYYESDSSYENDLQLDFPE